MTIFLLGKIIRQVADEIVAEKHRIDRIGLKLDKWNQ